MKMMYHMLIALTPVTLYAIYSYRLQALGLIVITIATAVITEALYQKLFNKPLKIKDFSAAVTGLLLALSLSPSTPFHVGAAGAFVGILFGKQLFGGFGKNLLNPALFGRFFIIYAFPNAMTPWLSRIDAVSTATPLQILRDSGETAPLFDLFIGLIPGSIGEMSALLLIGGGIYLIYKNFANWRIPASCLGTVAIFALAVGHNPFFHLFAGSIILGAFYMATDPMTSPRTNLGRYIFGVAIGIIVMSIRLWGWVPEGTTFAILGMNLFVPLINKYTKKSPAKTKA